MELEEVALRAKIQAMKNLLKVKNMQSEHTSLLNRTHVRTSKSYNKRNQSWFTPTSKSHSSSSAMSTNKVWVNENALKVTSPFRLTEGNVQARAVHKYSATRSRAKRVMQRMQLNVLRLEDGEYSKTNGDFSLIRSDVLKSQVDARQQKREISRPPTLTRRISSSCANTHIPITISERARVAVSRARAIARSTAKKSACIRTEHCRFYAKFGYCKKKNECKYLHDSRRITLCRKYIQGECTNESCLLSHDKNKMPDCIMFLRGTCTREDCRFRHVKVSEPAPVCDAFLQGYCPKGETCKLRHELTRGKRKKRLSSSKAGPSNITANPNPSGTTNQLDKAVAEQYKVSLCKLAPDVGMIPSLLAHADHAKAAMELCIRPNIQFAPRNLPFSLNNLHKKAKLT